MRHLRHSRHRRYARYERHGNDLARQNSPAPTASIPATREGKVGASVTVACTATGTGPLSYKWFKGATEVSGQTSATLTLSNAQVANNGTYSCEVTDSFGVSVKSGNCVVTIYTAVTSPAIAAINITEPAALTIECKPTGGKAPYTYVWSKGGTAIPGATSATYTKATTVVGDSGTYTCKVTDALAQTVSPTCAVTVAAKAA